MTTTTVAEYAEPEKAAPVDPLNPDALAVGDVVYLKGGSPRMTILVVTDRSGFDADKLFEARVGWYAPNVADMNSATVDIRALTKVNPQFAV